MKRGEINLDILLLVVVFLLLMLLGLPLAYTMIISSIIYMITFQNGEIIAIIQRLSSGVNTFTLLAVPFFILAGNLMNYIGVTDKLFIFARKLVGHITGGLGHVNVLASMLFAGMSGSSSADAGGLGAIEMKAMKEAGYSERFSAAITAASSTIGPIIPPSIIIVLYGVMAEVSIGRLFAGAIIPGILMGLALMVTIYILAKKGIEECPVEPRASIKEVMVSFKSAILPLMAPVILVVGILSGIFTPTEAGAVVVFYTLFLGWLYKTLNIKMLIISLKETMHYSVVTLFFIASAKVFLWIITNQRIPETIINSLMSITSNQIIIIFLLIVSLLVIGLFISSDAALILVTPVLLQLAIALELDLIHLGIFVVITLVIGAITPPVGLSLFIVSKVGGVSYAELSRAIIPFIIPLVIVVLIIAYFPILITFVPDLIYN